MSGHAAAHTAGDKGHAGSLTRLMRVLAEAATIEDLIALALPVLVELLDASAAAVFAAGPEGWHSLGEHVTPGLRSPTAAEDEQLDAAYTGDRTVRLDRPYEPTRTPNQTTFASGVWLPLPGNGSPSGVLRMLRRDEEPFTDADMEVLEGAARRIGHALQQAELYEEAQRLGRNRAQLLELSAQIAGRLDFRAVAQRVVEGVTAATDFRVAIVSVREGHTCRRLAASGIAEARIGLVTPFAEWAELIKPAFRRGRISYLLPPGEASVTWEQIPEFDELEGPDAWTAEHGLVVELLDADGEIVGFLSVDEPRSRRLPSNDQIETLELFARQAQVALVNALLYEEARRRRDEAETLRRVSEAVSSSLDLPRVLEVCCRATVEQSVADRASILLFDPAAERFRPMMTYVLDASAQEDASTAGGPKSLPSATMTEMPALARAVESGLPVLIEDVARSQLLRPHEAERFAGCGAAIYPMLAADEVVGVLILETIQPHVPFPQEEVTLMRQIAAHTAIAIRQARLHADARDHAKRTRDLLEITKAMTRTFEFEVILSHIVSALRTRMSAGRVAVFDAEEGHLRLLHYVSDHADQPPYDRIEVTEEVHDLTQEILARGPLVVADPGADPVLAQYIMPGTKSMLLAGHGDGGSIGVIMTVWSEVPAAFTQGDAEFCEGLVEVLALALRNARLYEEARRAAERDSLTGLLNRRMFWPQLKAHIEQATPDTPVALAVLDIDDFKRVNDRFGHAVGDRALRHVTDRLLRTVRETDLVYRLGGEEFTVVMPHTTAEEARGVLERVLAALGRSRRDVPHLTISVGIALAPQQGTSGDALFRAADRSLYTAKHAGKNQIVVARPR